jgi:hypothetical protein
MSDDATPPEQPTPWAVVKRMQAEGHSRDVIAERLKAMGVEADDIRVLLYKDLPAPPPDDGGRRLLAVGAAVVGGPLLGTLVAVALSEPPALAVPAAPQQSLNPLDTSPRCAWHPTLASVASCPRCGAFTCRDCEPRPDERMCEPCRTSPPGRDLRIRKAVRWISVWMFSVTAMALLEAGGSIDDGPTRSRTLLELAMVGGPFTVLGFMQLGVLNLWPAFVATVVVVPVLPVTGTWGLWIIMAVVLTIATLFARSEISSAKQACRVPAEP